MYKTYFNWSSGKDSSLALYYMLQQKEYNISTLVTTVNRDFDRVSMHGLRVSLLEQQAKSLDIPLHKIEFPAEVSMSLYDQIMQKEVNNLKNSGYTHCCFGDIFLEDLKAYRESQLQTVGVQGVFPIWKRDTKVLLEEFIDLGFRAITVCVNANYLDESFCGRELDHDFLRDLPENVDPCGENGEFHTFVFDGPIFKESINFEIGEKVLRNYKPSDDDNDNCYTDRDSKSWDTSFWYCDLVPV